MRYSNSKAAQYAEERFCLGSDCTAKSQRFLVEGAVQKVAERYAEEVLKDYKKKLINAKERLFELIKS